MIAFKNCYEETCGNINMWCELQNSFITKDPNKINSLGWLRPQDWTNNEILKSVQNAADYVRENFDTFIVLGIGGANNGARALISALEEYVDGPEIIWAATNLNSYAIQKVLDIIATNNCCIEVIAKNFETLEPGSWFRVLRSALEEKYGVKEASRRIICCGTPGQQLQIIADTEHYIFLPFPIDLGGRFSFLSPVGLLPVAVAGIPIQEIAEGAWIEWEILASSPKSKLPPAYQYAAFRNNLPKQYQVELLAFFEPRLEYFSKWWIQLFAESEGKGGRGIYPQCVSYSEDLHSVGQFIQEGTPIVFETMLEFAEIESSFKIVPSRIKDGFEYLDNKYFSSLESAAQEATLHAHKNKGVPVCEIILPHLNAKCMGALFYFFQAACYMSSVMLGVNGFNQPGVEAYKQMMFGLLGKGEEML